LLLFEPPSAITFALPFFLLLNRNQPEMMMQVIKRERELESGPGDERDHWKEGQEPAQKKRRFGEELHEKVKHIETEVSGLNDLADTHSIAPYLADIISQFTRLSKEVEHRLNELANLDNFLRTHTGSACANVNCSYFSVLPPELNLHILSFLNARELLNVSLVNRELQRLALDESLWKKLCDRRWREIREHKFGKGRMGKHFRRSWRDVFEHRLRVDENWRSGKYSRVLTLQGHESQVCCSQYDEEKIVSGSFDSSIKVWDIKNLEEKAEVPAVMTLKKSETPNAHSDRVLCLMFDGAKLVTGGRDETVKIWDLNVGKCVNTLNGHTDNVWYLQFDEQKIISGSADKTICFWDFRTGKPYNTLVGHERGLSCLHFEGDLLMSGSADKTIKLWDLRTNRCRNTLIGHTDAVYCLYYFRNKLISGGEDKMAKVWDLDTGKCTSTISDEGCKERHTGAIYCMQFDDRRLVTGSFDHTIKVWDVNTEECLHTFGKDYTQDGHFHGSTVRRVQFDDFKMVSASADRTIKIFMFDNRPAEVGNQ